METSIKKKVNSKLDYILLNAKRATTAESTWPDKVNSFERKYFKLNSVFLKEEFLDVIYWFRQIIGVVLGIIWGFLSLKGFIGIALFVKSSYLFFNSID